MPVLFDRDGKLDNQLIGKTCYMQSVHVINPARDLFGQIIDVRIIKAGASSLSGEMVL
jgi:tRNA-2-methylthio-N6-dimethylallyladenosine synthase